jgi:phage tail-like protein
MSETPTGTALTRPRAQSRRYRRPDDWMLAQLPSWMLADDLFRRFASMFQVVATTYLEHVDQLEQVFDPAVAPSNMVRAMGRWIGVDLVDAALDERLQREIVLAMAELPRWRGTRFGLQSVLELISGEPAEVTDSGGVYFDGEAPGRPPHVAIRVRSTGWTDAEHMLEFVRRELPVSVTFELWVGDEQLWPAPSRDVVVLAGITCPQCLTPSVLQTVRMAADEFCQTCDFPLFWAPGGVAPGSSGEAPHVV